MKRLKDIGLISALLEKGYSFRERQLEGKEVYFLFDWDEVLEDLEKAYFDGQLEVDAYAYNQEMKKIKTLIYRTINDAQQVSTRETWR